MTIQEILQKVISRLGDNYNPNDQNILIDIINDKINISISITNREINPNISDENLKLLSPEIIEASVQSYQLRGTEYAKSKSELGTSSAFVDVNETLRTNLIKNGKRVIF